MGWRRWAAMSDTLFDTPFEFLSAEAQETIREKSKKRKREEETREVIW